MPQPRQSSPANLISFSFPSHQHHLPPMSFVLQSSCTTSRPYIPSTVPYPRNDASSFRTPPISPSSYPLYDIAKIYAHNCTIIRGAAYNSAGHIICAVSNLREKPCMRVGKCPFHRPQPISSHNSTNGFLDASGTALRPSSHPNANISDSLTTPPPSLTPPKKRQYKRGWSLEEHFFFLQGLHVFGHGSWKKIEILVKSRDSTQIQSHAQKFQERQRRTVPNTKRSINDLTLNSPEMIEIYRLLKDTELKDRLREIESLGRLPERYLQTNENYFPPTNFNLPDKAHRKPIGYLHSRRAGVNGDDRRAFELSSQDDLSARPGIRFVSQSDQVYHNSPPTQSSHVPPCHATGGGGISHLLNPALSSTGAYRTEHSMALFDQRNDLEQALTSPRTITETAVEQNVGVANRVYTQKARGCEVYDIAPEREYVADDKYCQKSCHHGPQWVEEDRQAKLQDHIRKKRRLAPEDKLPLENILKLSFQTSADAFGNIGDSIYW